MAIRYFGCEFATTELVWTLISSRKAVARDTGVCPAYVSAPEPLGAGWKYGVSLAAVPRSN